MITCKDGKYFYMGHEITKDQAISILRNASAKLSQLGLWRKRQEHQNDLRASE